MAKQTLEDLVEAQLQQENLRIYCRTLQLLLVSQSYLLIVGKMSNFILRQMAFSKAQFLSSQM
jgi:hypothetical protein